MAQIINLRMARKSQKRQKEADKAQENRLKHGLSKPDKKALKHEKQKQKKHLDGHQLGKSETDHD